MWLESSKHTGENYSEACLFSSYLTGLYRYGVQLIGNSKVGLDLASEFAFRGSAIVSPSKSDK